MFSAKPPSRYHICYLRTSSSLVGLQVVTIILESLPENPPARQPLSGPRNEHLQAGSCQRKPSAPLVPEGSARHFTLANTDCHHSPPPIPGRTTHHLMALQARVCVYCLDFVRLRTSTIIIIIL